MILMRTICNITCPKCYPAYLVNTAVTLYNPLAKRITDDPNWKPFPHNDTLHAAGNGPISEGLTP